MSSEGQTRLGFDIRTRTPGKLVHETSIANPMLPARPEPRRQPHLDAVEIPAAHGVDFCRAGFTVAASVRYPFAATAGAASEDGELLRLVSRRCWLGQFGHWEPCRLERLLVLPVADERVVLAAVAWHAARGQVAFVVGAATTQWDDMVGEFSRRSAVGALASLLAPTRGQPVELRAAQAGSCGESH